MQRAREHYQEGTKAYDLGRFDDAAREYEQAYEAKDDPALLFNIAQAYRFGKRYDKAILSYRSYLRRVPDAPNRAEIQSIMVELQRLLDEQKKTESKPPTDTLQPVAPAAGGATTPSVSPPPAPAAPTVAQTESPPTGDREAERRGRRLKLIGIGVGAVGVAALIAGAALWGAAGATADHVNNLTMPTVFDPAEESRFNTFQTTGIALVAVGGAALVTGAALLAVGVTKEHRNRVALVPAAGSGARVAEGF
ncbi:MAG TPA: tetratricopeptide repeat protein [Polyangia bacterium]